MIIVKTSYENIDGVVRNSKYALMCKPSLGDSEIILIAQTKKSLRLGDAPIRYMMEFVRAEADTTMESLRIWGRPWTYLIIGNNCKKLRHPFDLSKIQISPKSYLQGGSFAYVEPEDEAHLRENGHLETID